MRVIAGVARGRRLQAPRGGATRPTPDRVREALFAILGNRLPDARVLDLFAGSGALGIEAWSRGAAEITFVEAARPAQQVLRKNIAAVELPGARILAMQSAAALRRLAGEQRQFDLVFLDPPYDSDLLRASLAILAQRDLVAAGGTVVCEHPASGAPPQPPVGWSQPDTRRYGDVAITLFVAGEDGGNP